ncbi:NADPH-dependent F420 reductase [Kitasatospora sp. NPDC006697]|uniref:NADPH-dependent F420 reductase n=1 Tax=Kitasatospora sp. NPDC006697 TaxID=3364020 RepID=UPI003689779B
MKIAVLGTGEVGRTLATRLAGLGHQVTMGSRTADNREAADWAAANGGAHGTFATAAAEAELVVNATAGQHALAALTAAGAEHLGGKTVIDVSNALDFSAGFPPKVLVPAEGSVAEQLQAAFPEARIVKTLNTVNNPVMVAPEQVPGPHVVFLSGEDATAKQRAAELLRSFGWGAGQIVDLGGVATARGTEAYMNLWLPLYAKVGHGAFNITLASA